MTNANELFFINEPWCTLFNEFANKLKNRIRGKHLGMYKKKPTLFRVGQLVGELTYLITLYPFPLIVIRLMFDNFGVNTSTFLF